MKDKNGTVIRVGHKVRKCATYKDYLTPMNFEVEEKNGELFVDNISLSEYITGNDYTSLEIV